MPTCFHWPPSKNLHLPIRSTHVSIFAATESPAQKCCWRMHQTIAKRHMLQGSAWINRNMGRITCHRHESNVRSCQILRQRPLEMGRVEGEKHAEDVSRCDVVQRRPFKVGCVKGERHAQHVFGSDSFQTGTLHSGLGAFKGKERFDVWRHIWFNIVNGVYDKHQLPCVCTSTEDSTQTGNRHISGIFNERRLLQQSACWWQKATWWPGKNPTWPVIIWINVRSNLLFDSWFYDISSFSFSSIFCVYHFRCSGFKCARVTIVCDSMFANLFWWTPRLWFCDLAYKSYMWLLLLNFISLTQFDTRASVCDLAYSDSVRWDLFLCDRRILLDWSSEKAIQVEHDVVMGHILCSPIAVSLSCSSYYSLCTCMWQSRVKIQTKSF